MEKRSGEGNGSIGFKFYTTGRRTELDGEEVCGFCFAVSVKA